MHDVVLRRGIVDETGARHRRASIRPLNGREEEALTAGGLNARAASSLLAACVVRLGGFQEITDGLTSLLTRGDRWRLALALRQLMNGDELVLSLACPNPECGELADLTLSIHALLDDEGEAATAAIDVDTADGVIWLRAPTGLDDEVVEEVAAADPLSERDARSALMWSRLVLDVGGHGPIDPTAWHGLDTETHQRVARALVELDGLLDLAFVSSCPSCEAGLELELDPFELLERELGLGAGRLLAEVHSLAFHYGWSEDNILGLPRSRRWAYLELLRNQLEGRPLVDLWS